MHRIREAIIIISVVEFFAISTRLREVLKLSRPAGNPNLRIAFATKNGPKFVKIMKTE